MQLLSFEENPQGVTYLAICIIFQVIACAVIGLRFASKYIQKMPLQVSDWSIIAALILATVNLGVLGASVRAGMGWHFMDLFARDPGLVALFSQLQTAISAIWIFSLFAIKVSILFTYMAIFSRSAIFIKICWVFLVIQVLWLIGAFLNIMLLCMPIAYLWDKTIPGGRCVDQQASYLAAHIIIFVLDFGLAVLPIPVLWGLNMSAGKKVGVAIMFSLGLVIGIFDMMRIAWRSKIDSLDVTYDYALLFCFTVLEAQLGIVLACIPHIQPVLRKWMNVGPMQRFRSVFTRTQAGTRGTNTGPKPSELMTFKSANGHYYAQKSQSSDTDSVRPLGDEASFGGQGADRSWSLKHDPEAGHRVSGTIQVTREWGVHH